MQAESGVRGSCVDIACDASHRSGVGGGVGGTRLAERMEERRPIAIVVLLGMHSQVLLANAGLFVCPPSCVSTMTYDSCR